MIRKLLHSILCNWRRINLSHSKILLELIIGHKSHRYKIQNNLTFFKSRNPHKKTITFIVTLLQFNSKLSIKYIKYWHIHIEFIDNLKQLSRNTMY